MSPLAPASKRTASRSRRKAKASQAAAPVKQLVLTAAVVRLAQSPGADPAARHNALEAIRSATPEQREEVCPKGLAGKQRTRFVTDGVLVRQDIELARQHAAINAALEAAKTKESTMSTTKSSSTRKAATARTRKQERAAHTRNRAAATGGTKRTVKRAEQASVPVEVTAAQVARDHELDPVAFRKWLRASGTERDFSTKAKVRKAVAAFRKQA